MTATLSPPAPRRGTSNLSPVQSEAVAVERVLLHDVSWKEYDTLCELFAERHIFLTYDQGDLEIRMPSVEHDSPGFLFDAILAYVTRYFGMLIVGIGSTTLRKKIKSRGLEPDRAFYVSHAREVLGKKQLDISVDPPPDLAIEIDIASSSIPRMPIYAALEVPEVWRWDGQSLRFYLLQGADYLEVAVSTALPRLTSELVAQWLTIGETQGVHAVYDAIDVWWESASVK
jgi:Uma2 family endonuclease